MKKTFFLISLFLLSTFVYGQTKIRISQIEDIQGTVIKSIGETASKVLTTNGSGSSTWQTPTVYAPLSGSTNYIQNQNASAQTANLWITGNGTFGGTINSTSTNGWAIGSLAGVVRIDYVSSQFRALNASNTYTGFKGTTFESTVTAISPFVVASTVLNTNLNADLLDGKHLTDLNTAGTLTNVAYKGTLTTNYLLKYGVNQLENSLVYDNGTNVGIGIIPEAILDIYNPTATIASLIRSGTWGAFGGVSQSGDVGFGSNFYLTSTGPKYLNTHASVGAIGAYIDYTGTTSNFHFISAPSNSTTKDLAFTPNYLLTILNTGATGIGINPPLAKLHVYNALIGDVAIIESAAASGRLLFKEAGVGRGYLGYGDDGNIFTGALANSMSLRSENALHLGGSGNNLAMTILSGRTLIGTTTDNGVEKLQVNGGISASTIKLTTGVTTGYFLKSDAFGNGTWAAVAASQVYKGTWNATTNTPTLANGTGTAGWYYRCVVAGTVNFGAGNITFAIGDDAYYNGTVWERIPAQGYTLQAATASVLGGIKVGGTLNMSGAGSDILNVTNNGHNHTAGNITDFQTSVTANTNVTDAYNDRPTAVSVSAGTSKTITITQGDATALTAVFTDIDTDTDTGDEVKVNGVATVNPDFVTSGSITLVNVANSITANLNTIAGLIPDSYTNPIITIGGDGRITAASNGSSGAPANVNYLVGTADAALSAEIVVGTSPGGDLQGTGSTWASPQITDNSHMHNISSLSHFTVSQLDGVLNDGGNIDLVAGANITITPDDINNTITIASTAGAGMVYPGAGIALSTGAAWAGSITNNSGNWNTAYSERATWDGGTSGLVAATARTSLSLEPSNITPTSSNSASGGYHTHSMGIYGTPANGNSLTYSSVYGFAWTAISGTPGGSTTQVQYNNGGAFAGSASFTYASGTGVVTATNFALSSDRRLKNSIQPLGGIEWVDDVHFKSFFMNNDLTGRLRYGVIAQELEKINPFLVTTTENGYKAVSYIDLLIAKVARQDEIIEKLEKRLNKLDSKDEEDFIIISGIKYPATR